MSRSILEWHSPRSGRMQLSDVLGANAPKRSSSSLKPGWSGGLFLPLILKLRFLRFLQHILQHILEQWLRDDLPLTRTPTLL